MADQFKPVVPWPHVEGVEVDLESIRQKNGDKPNPELRAQNQQNVIQKQYVTFKPHTNVFSEPVLKKGILGNFEPKEPEPQGSLGGPGEGANRLCWDLSTKMRFRPASRNLDLIW